MEPTVEQRERRCHSVNFQGVFYSDTVQGEEAVVLDLSQGGCRVGSPIPMPIDTAIHLLDSASPSAPHLYPQGDRALGKGLCIRCAVPRIS